MLPVVGVKPEGRASAFLMAVIVVSAVSLMALLLTSFLSLVFNSRPVMKVAPVPWGTWR